MKQRIPFLLVLVLLNCTDFPEPIEFNSIENNHEFQIKTYSSIPKVKVMVVGTYHFDQEEERNELSEENQKQIDNLVNALAEFKPSKVIIEKRPEFKKKYSLMYSKYQAGQLSIDTLANEIFQLGFKTAMKMNHDSIYFFDNQPDFIGSLEGFTFEGLEQYADSADVGFYDIYKDLIIENFEHNEKLLKSQTLYDEIKLRNAPQMQTFNIERMHAFEIRVGIDNNWIGADWLGRWYQRNIRMMAHLLKIYKPDDRLLIIVGDNHKWVLEQLMNNTPDFEVVSSFEYLNK
ncbi:DUF5694 domain-containing protein [Fulvivirga lutimaris]|uniref:DUF5694 domain-containing protein n=1 Tax=Fulvivirga lutimaris TaxID=1819566 RepID=UPI0012BD2B38|nr:DUF5694 domain-containing protein [Fulvivirga lutimaris]MTI40821.1 hypothetical protein [Fulvivirga lutimaris]